MKRDNSKYHFSWGENLVDFNSLSPDGNFYYQITTPTDMYWGLFVARISFLDIEGTIIHYDKSVFASPLRGKGRELISYASYSADGGFAYYLERIDANTLNHVVVDLKNQRLKRVKWSKTMNAKFRTPEHNGFTEVDLGLFDNEDWTSTKTDKRKERNLLLKHIWKP